MKSNNNLIAGFTLIEILIVIGILGVLATVLVVTINPGEVQKKTRDAQRLKDIAAISAHLASMVTGGAAINSAVTTYTNSGKAADNRTNVSSLSDIEGMPEVKDPLCIEFDDCTIMRKPMTSSGSIGPTARLMQYYVRANGFDYAVATFLESFSNKSRLNTTGCVEFAEVNNGGSVTFNSRCTGL